MRQPTFLYTLYTTQSICLFVRTLTFSGVARNLEEKDIEGRRNTKLLSLAKKEVDENRVDLPPGDQLGAGGLDRRLFAYLPKNWARLVTSLALQKSVQEKERSEN